MKLWKSKKSAATSCVSAVSGKLNLSGNSKNHKNEDQIETISSSSTATPTNQIQIVNGLHQGRALSPAQSEDSGLAMATDRGTTYATISIPRQSAQSMGIILTDRSDVTYPPMIETINLLEPNAEYLAPGDRIHQIDGISTVGLTNEQVMNLLLCNREEIAVIEIEYSLPDYLSQNSLCVTTKLAQVVVERENGCLGLTLRGGGTEMPIIITNVRTYGPAYKTSRIKPGDRVLRVDNISLVHKSLTEAQQILKCGHNNPFCTLTIEYEVSVMQSVEFSLGPLLIEIERSMNEQMGLVLSNYMPLSSDFNRIDTIQPSGIFISNIIPASISDRCGALSIGDQILSVDETIVENTSLTPDDVLQLLDNNCTKGFTQLQIFPAHAILRRKGLHCTSPKFTGFNTIDPRRTPKMSQHKKFYRKSSLPLDNNSTSMMSTMARTERIQVVLDCTHGSGLCLSMTPQSGNGFVVTKILPDSVADRSGCIQKGDRIVSVNKLYNLDIQLIRQILRDSALSYQSQQQTTNAHWVELEIEFDMIVDESMRGIFNVKLMKISRNAGLGITVNGSSHGAFVVTDIKLGSSAHRGNVKVGDILLAIDSHPIQHFNVDVLLKENKNDYITLTIKRNAVADYLYENQSRQNAAVTYANYEVLTNNFNGLAINGNGNNNNLRTNDIHIKQNTTPYFNEEPHYSVVPAPRYWNTLKPNKSEHQNEDVMGNSISATDLVSYSNIDYAATQKMMSMSIGPTTLATNSHSTQTDENDSFMPNNNVMMTSSFIAQQPNVFNVKLQQPMPSGPLGITLSGNEDGQKPIIISGLAENGIAAKTGQIQVGDTLLAINNENVIGLPLSSATKLLQIQNSDIIELRLSRNNALTNSIVSINNIEKLPQPQALYAEVQRRPLNMIKADALSNSSSRSGSNDGQLKTIHVTLYKDQVYDDYGFSVSDGLYERGVYINRIRTGGPADQANVLKPYDRIIQVNGTKTTDFDCCLTVPLIAAATGDKINLIVQRGAPE
ncbi:hypothetical protein PVAND_013991 [Polypedilum vanderplanki]|uniref:PDZ domain-containing protein n=1 Tax=Polypedilum vanderplanki TaxID=319348 RepID=A0A9J6CR12_POLVA|nr:hypothetical protein PVAND_013991 [Polypedilum vanderplanki]